MFFNLYEFKHEKVPSLMYSLYNKRVKTNSFVFQVGGIIYGYALSYWNRFYIITWIFNFIKLYRIMLKSCSLIGTAFFNESIMKFSIRSNDLLKPKFFKPRGSEMRFYYDTLFCNSFSFIYPVTV